MNQKIFETGLSVETISVYLLCCSLADSGQIVSTQNLLGIWNGAEETLIESLKELERKKILFLILSDQKENTIYQLTGLEEWKA